LSNKSCDDDIDADIDLGFFKCCRGDCTSGSLENEICKITENEDDQNRAWLLDVNEWLQEGEGGGRDFESRQVLAVDHNDLSHAEINRSSEEGWAEDEADVGPVLY